jgi:hypothetical protein
MRRRRLPGRGARLLHHAHRVRPPQPRGRHRHAGTLSALTTPTPTPSSIKRMYGLGKFERLVSRDPSLGIDKRKLYVVARPHDP